MYGVRSHEVLGPIFAVRITDWMPHLEQMFAFWSSVMLKSGRYHGQLMAKHVPLRLAGAHFAGWLTLFEQAAQLLPPPAAGDFQRARQIAGSLELGVAAARGEIRLPGAVAPHPRVVLKP
jgi:hemoglobin